MAARKDGKQGHKSDKLWRDAIMLAVNDKDGAGRKNLRILAEKTVELAKAGDMQAIKEIGDRLDGKPAQAVQHSDGDGNPLPPFNVYLTPPK